MIWPDIPKHQIGALLALLLFALFGEALPAMVEGGAAWWEPLRNTALSGVLFLGAHLLHAISSARLTRRRKGRRPVPKVALDLLRLALFAAATLASLSLFFRQDLSGIEASSLDAATKAQLKAAVETTRNNPALVGPVLESLRNALGR